MEIEKKYISRKNWKRVTERIDAFEKIENKDVKGIASIICIKKVKEPSFKIYNNKKIKIVDDGYFWLQIGLEDKNYWITAMYNEKRECVQYYIDITEKNVIDDYENSYFYDIFLDIVLLPSGEIFLLDEDELKEALDNKIITKAQYDNAYSEANRIMKVISKDYSYLENLCNNCFSNLQENIGDNNK